MIREAIENILKKIDLSEGETREVFEEIMTGKAAPSEIVQFLVGLRDKGETVEEITGAAKVMREKALRIDAGKDLVDTCGTGGSKANTFNISTAAAFVVAGCGLKVAKHGNRSASSQCGSADVLEALGVNLNASALTWDMCIREIGIGFMYAPLFHSAMKYAIAPRKEIKTRTIFNLLGPLSNPAAASSQVIGVYDSGLTEKIALVLKRLGIRRAFVVHGADSLDEITITGKTMISELKDGDIKSYYVTPASFGVKSSTLDDIKGGNASDNAEIMLSVLKGGLGPRRDVVLVNASAALIAGFKTEDFKSGLKLAEESIDSGEALDKLEKLIELTNK